MYLSSGPSSVRSSGGTDDGTLDLDDMDTSPGVFEAKLWPRPEEREQEFFENGEYLPSAIDTTQHSYNAVCDRDKLGVRYRGSGSHSADWGTVRANHPIPRRRRMFYFEATIASQGEQGCITIGLAGSSFPTNKQPGTEDGSYGLEGSNGYVFTGSGSGQRFGHALSTGDTVGLGVNFKKMEAFLTHNGQLLGPAFPGIRSALDAAGLYPCVGLHSPGEAVRLNFGRRPFLFDLCASVAEEDSREQAAVASVHVSPSLLRSLVRDYLLHQGCEQTLRSLGEADGEGETWTKDPSTRQKAGASTPPPPSARPPPPSTQNGFAYGERCNGATSISGGGDGETRITSLRPSHAARGASRHWASPALAWSVDGRERVGGGRIHSSSGSGSDRRVSEDMDVEEGARGLGGMAGGGGSSTSRLGQTEGDEEGREGVGGREGARGGEGETRGTEVRGSSASPGAGLGVGGRLGSYENNSARHLLQHLQLHLGEGGEMVFGTSRGVSGSVSGGLGAGSGSYLFSRQMSGSRGEGGGGGVRGGGDERRTRRQRGGERGDQGQSVEERRGGEQVMDDEEDEEEEDEEEEVGVGTEDEGVDPEHEALADMMPIQSEAYRENGCSVAVTELLADGGGPSAQPRSEALVATLSLRTRLRRSILSGDIDAATRLLQAERPGLLERRPDVRFALKCQAFIELIKKGDLTGAVILAQRELSPFREAGRTLVDSPKSQTVVPRGHDGASAFLRFAASGRMSASWDVPMLLSGRVQSSAPLGAGHGARSGSRRDGGGRGSPEHREPGMRSGEARSNVDCSESEEDGTERRTRKRRTRSYDRLRLSEDGQDSSWEAGAGRDRSLASGEFSEPFRKAYFPSTLCGPPSVYDSKLVAVMGLLAYKDPASSPLGHLVSSLQNQAIADKVNDAVLVAEIAPRKAVEISQSNYLTAPISGLEMVVRHLLATRQASRETTGDVRQQATVHSRLHF